MICFVKTLPSTPWKTDCWYNNTCEPREPKTCCIHWRGRKKAIHKYDILASLLFMIFQTKTQYDNGGFMVVLPQPCRVISGYYLILSIFLSLGFRNRFSRFSFLFLLRIPLEDFFSPALGLDPPPWLWDRPWRRRCNPWTGWAPGTWWRWMRKWTRRCHRSTPLTRASRPSSNSTFPVGFPPRNWIILLGRFDIFNWS